jgi:glutamate/tyrosine decarboxylase-like PLP-dependent enzyme
MLNRVIKKLGLYDIGLSATGRIKVGNFNDLPNLTQNNSLTPSACFLGPRAENVDAFGGLIQLALTHITTYRKGFWPSDPSIEPDEGQADSLKELESRFKELLDYLGKYETPFSSLRYQGHMLSDNLLPALAGYFVTMLHNPNNVTIQASTATTLLEMLVMRDLCDMFAFTSSTIAYNNVKVQYPVTPWAHATVDGSIANIESAWSAREAKYIPFAIKLLVDAKVLPTAVLDIEVALCNGTSIQLGKASDWQLLNLTRNERLSLPLRIASQFNLDVHAVWNGIATHDVNALGWKQFASALGQKWPILLVPSTAHYSWPKAAAVLGLGTDGCQHVLVDKAGRMDCTQLRKALDKACKDEQPILSLVSVFGSTEESAVDPLNDLLQIREEYRRAHGLDFDIHVDGAWGGYFVTCIREAFQIQPLPKDTVNMLQAEQSPFLEDTSTVPLSAYVIQQAQNIRRADSVTVDPHKMGYIQYPAGFVMYGNQDVTNLTTFTGSYIGSASDPTMGLFGLEGSRPGASPAAVYFAHTCLRPDHTGYGKVICRSLHNTRQLYAALQLFKARNAPFTTATLTPFGGDQAFVDAIFGLPLEKIQSDPALMAVYKEFGPDQNIVDYGFNPQGNSSPATYNQFITDVYNKLHVHSDDAQHPDPISSYPLLITVTEFARADYGAEFIDAFASQLGLAQGAESLKCLRSTVMSPFVSETQEGSFWPTIQEILFNTVNDLCTRKG